MKINWLNYTHHVLSCLFVTLSILTIFSAEYVVFPTSLLLGCLLIPLLFEQHLFLLFDLMVMLLVDRLHETPQTMEARHRNIE